MNKRILLLILVLVIMSSFVVGAELNLQLDRTLSGRLYYLVDDNGQRIKLNGNDVYLFPKNNIILLYSDAGLGDTLLGSFVSVSGSFSPAPGQTLPNDFNTQLSTYKDEIQANYDIIYNDINTRMGSPAEPSLSYKIEINAEDISTSGTVTGTSGNTNGAGTETDRETSGTGSPGNGGTDDDEDDDTGTTPPPSEPKLEAKIENNRLILTKDGTEIERSTTSGSTREIKNAAGEVIGYHFTAADGTQYTVSRRADGSLVPTLHAGVSARLNTASSLEAAAGSSNTLPDLTPPVTYTYAEALKLIAAGSITQDSNIDGLRGLTDAEKTKLKEVLSLVKNAPQQPVQPQTPGVQPPSGGGTTTTPAPVIASPLEDAASVLIFSNQLTPAAAADYLKKLKDANSGKSDAELKKLFANQDIYNQLVSRASAQTFEYVEGYNIQAGLNRVKDNAEKTKQLKENFLKDVVRQNGLPANAQINADAGTITYTDYVLSKQVVLTIDPNGRLQRSFLTQDGPLYSDQIKKQLEDQEKKCKEGVDATRSYRDINTGKDLYITRTVFDKKALKCYYVMSDGAKWTIDRLNAAAGKGGEGSLLRINEITRQGLGITTLFGLNDKLAFDWADKIFNNNEIAGIIKGNWEDSICKLTEGDVTAENGILIGEAPYFKMYAHVEATKYPSQIYNETTQRVETLNLYRVTFEIDAGKDATCTQYLGAESCNKLHVNVYLSGSETVSIFPNDIVLQKSNRYLGYRGANSIIFYDSADFTSICIKINKKEGEWKEFPSVGEICNAVKIPETVTVPLTEAVVPAAPASSAAPSGVRSILR